MQEPGCLPVVGRPFTGGRARSREAVLAVPLLAVAIASGCASSPRIMTPRVAAALTGAGIDRSAVSLRASAYWSAGFGHGLRVEIGATRLPSEYDRTLDLETRLAVEACAALSRWDPVFQWDFLEVSYKVHFGAVAPSVRDVAGIAEVVYRRETLRRLRDGEETAAEFMGEWDLRRGFKDQPDSKALLRW